MIFFVEGGGGGKFLEGNVLVMKCKELPIFFGKFWQSFQISNNLTKCPETERDILQRLSLPCHSRSNPSDLGGSRI